MRVCVCCVCVHKYNLTSHCTGAHDHAASHAGAGRSVWRRTDRRHLLRLDEYVSRVCAHSTHASATRTQRVTRPRSASVSDVEWRAASRAAARISNATVTVRQLRAFVCATLMNEIFIACHACRPEKPLSVGYDTHTHSRNTHTPPREVTLFCRPPWACCPPTTQKLSAEFDDITFYPVTR
jgi:hypothetical protein